MKVNGQLERAQFEQIVGDCGTPTLRGRVYADITDAARAVPKFCDGTEERTLAFEPTYTPVENNSGKEITIDWSTGLVQVLTLTDNCRISFSNPVNGREHVLMIKQSTTQSINSIYSYNFNINQEIEWGSYQPLTPTMNRRVKVFRWIYNSTAFVAASSANILGSVDPRVLPATLGTGIDIHPSGEFFIMGRTSSPFSTVMEIEAGPEFGSIETFYAQSAQTAPSALAAQAVNVAFHPSKKVAFYVSGTSPYIQAFDHNRGSAFGTVFANPSTLPTGAGRCLAVHPTGGYVAVGHTTTPFLSCYLFLGNAWGSKLSDPSTLPAAAVTGCAFSPMGDFLAVASQTTPFLQVYPFSGGAIGSVLANPSSLPTGGPAGSLGKGVAWHPSGEYVAIANTTSPFLYIVEVDRSTGTFGQVLTPSANPAGATTCLQFTPDGNYLLVGGGTTPYLTLYDVSALPTVTAISMGTTIAGQINDIAITPLGDIALLALNVSAFTQALLLPVKARNYMRCDP